MKKVCFIAHPRSGSTSLMKSIENLSRALCVLEAFHTSETVIKQHLNGAIGANKALEDELGIQPSFSTYREYSQALPKEYLSALTKLALSNEKELLLFKVFPGHLGDDRILQQVLENSDIIIKLRRNSLHSYLSDLKAIKVGAYANVDTTNVKVEFIASAFENWRSGISSFFSRVDTMCEQIEKTHSLYHYEDIYGDNFSKLIQLLNELGINSDQPAFSTQIVKQDKNTFATEKVTNPLFLTKYLSEHQIESYNDSRANEFSTIEKM